MTEKMDPEVKVEWLTELRSGNFEQGTLGHLCTENSKGVKKYCCLGVLSEIAIRHEVISSPYTPTSAIFSTDDQESHKVLEFDEQSEFLSERVAEWAGISSDTAEGVQNTLAVMNDGDPTVPTKTPQPFAVIADWIEENL